MIRDHISMIIIIHACMDDDDSVVLSSSSCDDDHHGVMIMTAIRDRCHVMTNITSCITDARGDVLSRKSARPAGRGNAQSSEGSKSAVAVKLLIASMLPVATGHFLGRKSSHRLKIHSR